MRALWLEDGRLRLRDDLPAPAPAAGEARIRVRLAGICNTDLELVKGYYPFAGVPGHEFVGVVDEAPSAREWIGRRVVGEINAWCGDCAACRAGRRTHCARRTVLGIKDRHGAFAEWLTLPLANLHAVGPDLPDERAVFAEPTAAALEIQEQVRLSPSDRVVVIGAGKLGHLVALTLAEAEVDLLVVGRQPERLAGLAARGLRTTTPDAVPPGQADVVVECTGAPEGFELARRALRPRGTLVLKSTYAGEARVNLSAVVVDEITVVGSRCGPFAPALARLARGLDVAPLVHARYGLDRVLDAFAHAARPGVLKVLVDTSSR